jgi:hypothetical protein
MMPNHGCFDVVQEALTLLQVGITRSYKRVAGTAESPDPLMGVLTYSFTQLDGIEQDMLLDVATVLYGLPESIALAAWKKLHTMADVASSLDNLEQRCLLERDGGCLHMHDVLKYLARGVVLGKVGDLSSTSRFVGSRVFVASTGSQESSWDDDSDSAILEVFGTVKVRRLRHICSCLQTVGMVVGAFCLVCTCIQLV